MCGQPRDRRQKAEVPTDEGATGPLIRQLPLTVGPEKEKQLFGASNKNGF